MKKRAFTAQVFGQLPPQLAEQISNQARCCGWLVFFISNAIVSGLFETAPTLTTTAIALTGLMTCLILMRQFYGIKIVQDFYDLLSYSVLYFFLTAVTMGAVNSFLVAIWTYVNLIGFSLFYVRLLWPDRIVPWPTLGIVGARYRWLLVDPGPTPTLRQNALVALAVLATFAVAYFARAEKFDNLIYYGVIPALLFNKYAFQTLRASVVLTKLTLRRRALQAQMAAKMAARVADLEARLQAFLQHPTNPLPEEWAAVLRGYYRLPDGQRVYLGGMLLEGSDIDDEAGKRKFAALLQGPAPQAPAEAEPIKPSNVIPFPGTNPELPD